MKEIDTSYTDDRGTIYNLVQGIQFIVTNKDKTRASHFHNSSGHICVLTRGSLEYYERPVGSDEKPTKQVLCAPKVFETQKMIEHTMFFKENETEFVCIRTGGKSDDPEGYEEDLVRLGYSLKDIYDEWEDGRFERGTQ